MVAGFESSPLPSSVGRCLLVCLQCGYEIFILLPVAAIVVVVETSWVLPLSRSIEISTSVNLGNRLLPSISFLVGGGVREDKQQRWSVIRRCGTGMYNKRN